MERDDIALLLHKYWKAETTVAEEKIIKKHFEDQELESAGEGRDLFIAISEYQKVKGKAVHFEVLPQKRVPWLMDKSYLMKAAAIFLLISLLAVFRTNYNHKQEAKETAEISRKVEADLLTMSKMLNKGYEGLNQSNEMMTSIKKLKSKI